MSRYHNQIYPTVFPQVYESSYSVTSRSVGDGLPNKSNALVYTKLATTETEGVTSLVDISGNDNHLSVHGYCVTFTGTEYIAGTQILGNETIIDYAGTGTPSIAAGKINVTAGTLEWVELSDGRKYVVQSSPTANQVKCWNINSYTGWDTLTLTGGSVPYFTTNGTQQDLFLGHVLKENLIGTTAASYRSEPSVSTHVRASSNVSFQVGSGVFSDFDGEAVFGDNSTARYFRHEGAGASSIIYCSVYIAMDDGLAPVPGGYSDTSADFSIGLGGTIHSSGYDIESIGNGVYKVSVSTSSPSAQTFDIYKSTSHTARQFKATRSHLYINPLAEYHKSIFDNYYHNTGLAESYVPIIKTYSTTPKIICIGDSLTATDYPLNLASLLPGATVIDAGVGGNSTSNMAARFQADVLDNDPDYICYFGCINSVVGDVSSEGMIADIKSMIDAAESAGIPMVAGTSPPFGNSALWTSDRQTALEAVNTWIQTYGDSHCHAVVDLYSALDDGSDNIIAVADNGDGLHVNSTANLVIAWHFENGLSLPTTELSQRPLDLLTPCTVSAPDSAALKAADDGTLFTAGTPNKLTKTDLLAMQGDQYWFTARRGGTFYNAVQDAETAAKIDKFHGLT